jgi:CheY-like chemotaxis protein
VRLGAGATFRCYCPVRLDRPAASATPPSAGVARGSETILLVEDDDQVRRLVSRILEKHGYHVLDASTPREALRLANQRAQRLHLLITDVVMPQMNGRELAERVRALRPDVEILYMSGYSEHLLDKNGVLEAGLNFLPKPITPAALTQAVRALLDPKKR